MLSPVLIENALDHLHMFQNICYESFQIYLLVLTYHFTHTNDDNHLDVLS